MLTFAILKALIVTLVLYLWLAYFFGHDTKQTSKVAHIAAHIGYALFLGAVIAWL